MANKELYEKVLKSAKLIESVIGNQEGDNPYKGECYIASFILWEMYEGENMHFLRKKDFYDEWHWWVSYNDGYYKEWIDITRKQYDLVNIPCPSDDRRGVGLTDKMAYTSYKKRIVKLKEKIKEYTESQNHQQQLD